MHKGVSGGKRSAAPWSMATKSNGTTNVLCLAGCSQYSHLSSAEIAMMHCDVSNLQQSAYNMMQLAGF